MFDVGFSELLLLAVVALVVLGPEKLPHAARMTGAWVGRIRRTVLGIQAEIEKEVAAQEMRDRIQKEVERLKSTEVAVNQELHAVENSIRQTVVDASNTVDAAVAPEAPAALPAAEAVAAPEFPVAQEALPPITDKTPAAP
jgi:sec-independent protein translocase protein TatB